MGCTGCWDICFIETQVTFSFFFLVVHCHCHVVTHPPPFFFVSCLQLPCIYIYSQCQSKKKITMIIICLIYQASLPKQWIILLSLDQLKRKRKGIFLASHLSIFNNYFWHGPRGEWDFVTSQWQKELFICGVKWVVIVTKGHRL